MPPSSSSAPHRLLSPALPPQSVCSRTFHKDPERFSRTFQNVLPDWRCAALLEQRAAQVVVTCSACVVQNIPQGSRTFQNVFENLPECSSRFEVCRPSRAARCTGYCLAVNLMSVGWLSCDASAIREVQNIPQGSRTFQNVFREPSRMFFQIGGVPLSSSSAPHSLLSRRQLIRTLHLKKVVETLM